MWIILGVPKTLKVKFDGFYRHNLVRRCQSGEEERTEETRRKRIPGSAAFDRRIGREMNEGTRPTWVGLA